MTNKRYRVLIGLDRDGTMTKDPGYFGRDPNWREQVQFLPGVIEGLKVLKQLPSTRVVVCSNQAGIARRFFDTERVVEINKHINGLLENQGVGIDDWYFCPYVDKDYAYEKNIPEHSPWVRDTDLRKPGAGMLRQAAENIGMKLENFDAIFVVGDKASDVQAGLNANGYGVLVLNEENQADVDKVELMERCPITEGRVFVCDSLLQAAKDIRLITRLNGVIT